MNDIDEFRTRSHALLVDLDASTNHMMMLISANRTSGPEWESAVKAQHDAFEHWMAFLNGGGEAS